MNIRVIVRLAGAASLVLVGHLMGSASASRVEAQQATRVFELRTYTTPDDTQFAMLNARFREHTTKIFERHGIVNVGYWTPVDTPNTLIYIVAHKSQEEAKKNWAEFRADPEWTKVSADSKAKGLTGVKAESKFLQPTDYSPMK